MKKIMWFANHLEEIVSSILLFLIFILLFYSIFGRMIGLNTIHVQEVIQYSFIISILFGVSYAAKEREHIRADILLESVSPNVEKILLLLADLIWIFFSACLAIFSIPFIQKVYELNQKTAMLEIPLWILYTAVPITAILTCIRIIQSRIQTMQQNADI